MTTYGNYDAGIPCSNKSCKSYGKPHPNCLCGSGGGMAEGGLAGFCHRDNVHQKTCEYFAEGGAPAAPGGGEVPSLSGQEAPPEDDGPAPSTGPGAGEIQDLTSGKEAPPEDDAASEWKSGQEAPEDDTPTDSPSVGTAGGAFSEGLAEEIPILGPLTIKAGHAVAAGLNQMTPDALLKPEWAGKSFAETFKKLEEESKAEAEEHPAASAAGKVIGMAASLAPANAAAGAAAELANLSKAGTNVVKYAISNGLIQSADEVDKWILGQGDPNEAVGAKFARVGFAAGLGSIFGKLSNVAPEKLAKLAETKLGEKLQYFLYGVANAANKGSREIPEALSKAATAGYKAGHQFFDKMSGKLLPATLGATAEGYKGFKEDGIVGGLKGAGMGVIHGMIASKVSGLAAKGVQKYAAPAILRILANGNLTGITGAMDHIADMAAGSKIVSNSVESLIRAGSLGSAKTLIPYGDERNRQKVIDWLDNGGHNAEIKEEMGQQVSEPQPFAKGGLVEAKAQEVGKSVQDHFPEQNMIATAAKARIGNYLNSLRPPKVSPKLAFDDEPDMREKDKTFKRAVDIANAPLGVLHEVANGTLDVEHVSHFNALHPEVAGLVQKKLLESISKAQMDGHMPSFKVRQGLSLLLGAPLSGEFTPQNIQAAQMVFAKEAGQKHPDQKQGQMKKSTSTLSKSDAAFLTGSQAREKREQRA